MNMLLRAIAKQMDGPARYAWIVDKSLRASEDDPTVLVDDTEFDMNGRTGPSDAPPELLARLALGEGREWRTLYSEDEDDQPEDQLVVHVGRYLHLDGVDELDGDAFGPLHDLSQPHSGAVDVQYRDLDGETWSSL